MLVEWFVHPTVMVAFDTSGHQNVVTDDLAERSKALRSGRSLVRGVGSNPTVVIFCRDFIIERLSEICTNLRRRGTKTGPRGGRITGTCPVLCDLANGVYECTSPARARLPGRWLPPRRRWRLRCRCCPTRTSSVRLYSSRVRGSCRQRGRCCRATPSTDATPVAASVATENTAKGTPGCVRARRLATCQWRCARRELGG